MQEDLMGNGDGVFKGSSLFCALNSEKKEDEREGWVEEYGGVGALAAAQGGCEAGQAANVGGDGHTPWRGLDSGGRQAAGGDPVLVGVMVGDAMSGCVRRPTGVGLGDGRCGEAWACLRCGLEVCCGVVRGRCGVVWAHNGENRGGLKARVEERSTRLGNCGRGGCGSSGGWCVCVVGCFGWKRV
ncbi:uncharacterized protein A4U43_C01F18970 [Asparagus officinalis]|uniref:Uncharacterized protein n=1 Tax=Asparagus officinalis TaxID=4686 RepID=A0A5P1FV22_ASPOF|nr:uncharacterized protein A4U43_C01F18970 [Asparagus officinalis]